MVEQRRANESNLCSPLTEGSKLGAEKKTRAYALASPLTTNINNNYKKKNQNYVRTLSRLRKMKENLEKDGKDKNII